MDVLTGLRKTNSLLQPSHFFHGQRWKNARQCAKPIPQTDGATFSLEHQLKKKKKFLCAPHALTATAFELALAHIGCRVAVDEEKRAAQPLSLTGVLRFPVSDQEQRPDPNIRRDMSFTRNHTVHKLIDVIGHCMTTEM